MKGRLSQDKVNYAVAEIQAQMEAKYRILATPTSKLSEAAFKRYRTFRDQETRDTKGKFFFVEADLREGTHIKPDPAGRSVLTILRHLHRITEVRAHGIVRYVVQ